MKVYFFAPQIEQTQYIPYYQIIKNTFDDYGYKNLLPSQKTLPYQKMIKLLKEADINIFDCSMPDSCTGFQISKSLEFNKPTIALYQNTSPPSFIDSINEEKFLSASYNKESVKNVLHSLLQKAQLLSDKRFNFFISPSLLNYLNLMSHEFGMTKSTYLRNLIIEDKKKRRIDD